MANRNDEPELLPEVLGTGFGMVPIVGPLIQVLGERLARKSIHELQRHSSRVLRLAKEHSGLSREDLSELIDKDPRVVPLITRTLFAAGMNGQDKIIRTLAGFLGQALADTTKIDDVQSCLAAWNG